MSGRRAKLLRKVAWLAGARGELRRGESVEARYRALKRAWVRGRGAVGFG